MSMTERIENNLLIQVSGIDLEKVTKLEFYVKQVGAVFQYEPKVRSATEMTVTIPYEDAMKIRHGSVQMQFAFVDETGRPDSSDIISVDVNEFLKEAGYDPV